MKRNIISKVALIILFLSMFISLRAQASSEKFQKEIKNVLKDWNIACKNADLNRVMAMFDSSTGIMVVGSADGEISKGKDQIRSWLGEIFGFGGFSWEMNRLDIDSNGNTAWVFMDGKMIVAYQKGGTKITPYRFTGIMVKRKGAWKWKLFDGSIPQQE
ncbi:MAG: nuclear transport factor 2 family protein [Paludibacteraceae bacterium]